MTELIIQPDESASQDTYLSQGSKDTSYGTDTTMVFRQWNSTGTEAIIPLIKFDLSGLPAGAIVSAASLAVTLASTATRTTSPSWRRILPANSGWVEGATWNYANPTSIRWAGDTGGDGSNAGCRVSGTDYSATPIGSFSMTATSDVAGTVYTSVLDLTEFGYMIANNCGFILLYQAGGLERIYSSGAATEAYRPKLTITYTAAGGSLLKVNMNAQMQNLSGGIHG